MALLVTRVVSVCGRRVGGRQHMINTHTRIENPSVMKTIGSRGHTHCMIGLNRVINLHSK